MVTVHPKERPVQRCAGLFCVRSTTFRAVPCGRLVCHVIRFAVCVCLGCSRFARSMQPPALRTARLCTHAVGLWSVHSHPALGGRATPHPSRRRYPSGIHGAAALGVLPILTTAAALEMSGIAVSVSELGGMAAGRVRSRLQQDLGQEAGGDLVT